ncbi:hypothetical protein BT69DRAFT_1339891 [Atractiella rhizophila]|nr:hypothetical protein BT69DRAFT_1339891 [Atractiella rhizophila]
MALLKHSSGSPLVVVRSPQANLDLNTLRDHYGAIITFEIMDEQGVFVSSEVVEQAAGRKGICFRSGCMCNPGGAAVLMGVEHLMRQVKAGDTSQDMLSSLGQRADGLCRVSFGLASNFKDAWTLLAFLETLLQPGVLHQVVDSHQKSKQSEATQ